MEQKRCISSLTLAELTAVLKAMGQPGFRAKQIFHWVHQKLVTEFSAMTDQPKTLLAKLEETFYIAAPQIERRQEAKDGTVKYLLRMADGNCIETVVMRYHYGNTVCVSTQVGCRMAAGSAPPHRRGVCATLKQARSAPRSTLPRKISASASPISCSWASASRWTTLTK